MGCLIMLSCSETKQHRMVWRYMDEVESIWKEAVMASSRYYPSSCLVGLKKDKKNISQDSQSPGWDSNQASPKYKSQAIPLDQPFRWNPMTQHLFDQGPRSRKVGSQGLDWIQLDTLGPRGMLLWIWKWTFKLHKRQEISWPEYYKLLIKDGLLHGVIYTEELTWGTDYIIDSRRLVSVFNGQLVWASFQQLVLPQCWNGFASTLTTYCG